jgi:hypothetical protein
VDEEFLARLDDWRRLQPDLPPRARAAMALRAEATQARASGARSAGARPYPTPPRRRRPHAAERRQRR